MGQFCDDCDSLLLPLKCPIICIHGLFVLVVSASEIYWFDLIEMGQCKCVCLCVCVCVCVSVFECVCVNVCV